MTTESANGGVSIVVAAHNEGDNVRRTVESIVGNTDTPQFEILLVDDGSTDDSFAFLSRVPHAGDRRLRCYRFGESVGCIRARHQGSRLAQYDHIVFLDAHVSVPQGWLAALERTLLRWGPHIAITPDVSTLNEETWSANPSTGQVLTIDEDLGFVWQNLCYPTRLMATAGGCCVFMTKQLYRQCGGFDLGLRRWGCEFIDLIMKVYAIGGACYLEPSVLVGHLFRSGFPYPMHYRDVTYNKLRIGYIHLSDIAFRNLLERLTQQHGFTEAMVAFRADLQEIEHLRRAQRAANRRDEDWFVRMFLPGLGPRSRSEPPSANPTGFVTTG